jgi:hypothetical protein
MEMRLLDQIRLDRKNLCSIIALAAFLGGWAGAQAQNPSTDVAGIYASPAKRPVARKFIVDTVIPAPHEGGGPPVDTSGAIANFGGALQAFAIVTSTTEVRGVKSPFGGNVIFPLGRGRVELFGGVGGVYVPTASRYAMQDTWLTQTKLGVRVALDPDHHFWLGTTAYYLTNFAEKTQQWGYGSADLTFRFGR